MRETSGGLKLYWERSRQTVGRRTRAHDTTRVAAIRAGSKCREVRVGQILRGNDCIKIVARGWLWIERAFGAPALK